MNKPTSHFSNSPSNRKLRELFLSDPEMMGEMIDAAICNGIAGDLYNLRKTAGLTQRHLAEILAVKQSNISRWETPGYQGYKVKMLSKVVRTLGGRLSISIMPRNTYRYFLEFNSLLSIDERHSRIVTKNTEFSSTDMIENKKGFKNYVTIH